jgi:hypothetical protein
VWALGAGLVLTRIELLAHWASDVGVGLAVGAVTERLLRLVTGYGRKNNFAAKNASEKDVRGVCGHSFQFSPARVTPRPPKFETIQNNALNHAQAAFDQQ